MSPLPALALDEGFVQGSLQSSEMPRAQLISVCTQVFKDLLHILLEADFFKRKFIL